MFDLLPSIAVVIRDNSARQVLVSILESAGISTQSINCIASLRVDTSVKDFDILIWDGIVPDSCDNDQVESFFLGRMFGFIAFSGDDWCGSNFKEGFFNADSVVQRPLFRSEILAEVMRLWSEYCHRTSERKPSHSFL